MLFVPCPRKTRALLKSSPFNPRIQGPAMGRPLFLGPSMNLAHHSPARWRSLAYPWFIWALAAAFFFYKYVLQVFPSIMSADLMRAFDISGAGLGNLAACYFYAYLIMQIPVGILLDRYSTRWITSAAVFISAMSCLCFASAHSLLPASLARALMGFGTAFAAVSCFKLSTLWFPPKRFALMAGLSMTVAMLGAVGGEAPLAYLVKLQGWRETIYDCALPGFALAALIFMSLRDKKGNYSTQPDDVSSQREPLLHQLKKIMKSKQTWLLSLYSGLAFAPVSVFGGLWGVSFLHQAYDLDVTTAASTISLIFVGFAIGCPLSGWFSDYIGRRKIIMGAGTVMALFTIVAVLYLPQASAMLLSTLLFCFGLGASCFFLCFSMIREINTLAFAATVLGFMNTFDSLCEAVIEPFVGKLLDLGWDGKMDAGARLFSVHNYHAALAVLPLLFILGLVLMPLIKETHCRQV